MPHDCAFDRHRLALGRTRRKAARGSQRGLRRRRDFRKRLAVVQRQPARRREALPRSRSCDLRVPAVSRFRGHAGAATRPQFRQSRTQVRPDAGTGDRFAAGLQQYFAGLARRHRSRRGGFSRTRRTCRCARPAGRLRGAGLGTPRQRLSRRLGDRAACRPPIDRDHPRQLPCAGAGVSDQRDRIDPGRQDFPRSAGGRAETRSRCAVLEPAFPLLPRTGRPAGGRFHGRGADDRLWRPAVAGDLQRSVPLRLRGPHRDRRTALADAAGRPACGDLVGCASAKAATESAQPRRRVHRIRRQRSQGRRPGGAARPARLSKDRLAS